jgi:hypothetical protein
MSGTAETPLYKTAWKLYKTQIGKTIPTLFNFTMICFAVFAVAVLLPESLYVTFSFVVIPFFFAFAMSDSYLHHGTEITGRQFYRYYATYFQPTFFGSYRLIRNFFFAILISLAGALLTSAVYFGVAYSTDAAFKAAADAMLTEFAATPTLDLSTLITASSPLYYWLLAMQIGEFGALSLAFLHLTARAGLLPYLRAIMPGGNSRMINAVYGTSMKSIRTSYNRDYFSALWPGYLLVVAGYALGSVGSYYLVAIWGWAADSDVTVQISKLASYMWVGGLLGAFLTLLFFIPYYFQVMGLLIDKYKNAFAASSLTLANQALSELKEAQRIASEQAKEVEKSLDEAKKNADEDKDKDDDKDDDSKDDDHKGGSGNHPDLSDYGTSDHQE